MAVIATSNKVPGSYIKVSLGVGARSSGDSPRKILLYGNKLSAGTAVVDKVYQTLTVEDARTYFGRGSELARMVEAALTESPTIDLSAIAMTESAGVAASGTVTLTGTATAAGAITVTVAGVAAEASVASAATVTTAAAAVAAAINALPDLPVTASSSVGVVTITARHKGPRGNDIPFRVTSAVAGITATASGSALASGATTDDPQNALDAAAPVRYVYHVAPYGQVAEATALTKFKTHVTAQAQAEIGKREQYVFAVRSTLANCTTLATGQNEARGSCVWQYNADIEPPVMAAAFAAVRAREESVDTAANHDGKVVLSAKVAPNAADWPEESELVSALNNGITPLRTANGLAYVVRAITTRSQAVGGSPDYAVLDVSKVNVPDDFADDLDANWIQFEGFKAGPDVDPPLPISNILTPSGVKDFIGERLQAFADAGKLVEVARSYRETRVILAASPAGRFEAEIPLDVIEGAHQFTADARQIG